MENKAWSDRYIYFHHSVVCQVLPKYSVRRAKFVRNDIDVRLKSLSNQYLVLLIRRRLTSVHDDSGVYATLVLAFVRTLPDCC
jgi:hypothetical protein